MSAADSLLLGSASGWPGVATTALGMLGKLARAPSEPLPAWQEESGEAEEEEEVSTVAKVNFTGPLVFLSSELTLK